VLPVHPDHFEDGVVDFLPSAVLLNAHVHVPSDHYSISNYIMGAQSKTHNFHAPIYKLSAFPSPKLTSSTAVHYIQSNPKDPNKNQLLFDLSIEYVTDSMRKEPTGFGLGKIECPSFVGEGFGWLGWVLTTVDEVSLMGDRGWTEGIIEGIVDEGWEGMCDGIRDGIYD
jgi:hypothetical protein